jgi:hypothetical protein
MIIEAKDDILYLSGSFYENHWPTLEGAVRYLLRNHPTGIIVDCSQMTLAAEAGVRTFIEVLRNAVAQHWRVLFVNLPDDLLKQCRSIPGVRSQLPIAGSVEEARQSLEI